MAPAMQEAHKEGIPPLAAAGVFGDATKMSANAHGKYYISSKALVL